jgi:carbamoyl-phosphate synthase large subunit
MFNVLVTSIGAKFPLLTILKKSIYVLDQDSMLFGSDSNPDCLGRYGVDLFWNMPPLRDCSSHTVIDYCKVNNILVIIPTRDEEVIFFSQRAIEFKRANISVFCPPVNAVKLCQDKLFFAARHALSIPASENISDIKAKHFVVKERYGAGSENMLLNGTKTEAIEFAKNLSCPIFQPFIKGEEFSVDGYLNIHGKWVGGIVRKRIHVKKGEAKLTAYENSPNLLKLTKDLALSLKFRGHLVAQYIKSEDNIYLIECNARFGGASTLSYAMGLRSFEWYFKELKKIPYAFTLDKSITHQLRVETDIRW